MVNNRSAIKSISCDKSIVGMARGKVLYLRREGSADRGGDYFKINGTIGEGGSCVCYEATLLGEKKTGRLKEFYPLESLNENSPFLLERSEKNHLIATEKTTESFLTARADFVKSYHLLREVMQKNKNNADFTSFIPDFSVYYACDSEGNFIDGSTAYIWTAPENLTVFEKYLDDVRKHPSTYPEHKLFTILKTTLTLAECVKILHENGLLHLDIKPGNFGIPQRKGKLLTDSITLFDVNTIYSLKSAFTTDYGTEGFTAPEVANGRADNTSDIYSIGCTLFSALVTSIEEETVGYSKQYYTKIAQLIDDSKLIKASEINSNVFLKYELVTILKKCLAESQSKRYQSCVELVKDIEKALAYLYPAEINSKLPIGKQLVVLERELDRKQGLGSYLTFMYHLYKKPLFEYVPLESETLDVLIIGFGNYGQKFLDCCLQVGQVLGKKLNVKVVSNDRTEAKRDKDIYLAARPALRDFFSIDGIECRDSYGSIVFENREFVRGNLKRNKEIASEVVNAYNEGRYIFIALGDDSLNRGVAQAVVAATKDVRDCSVNFAYDGEHISGKVYGNPVYMSDNISEEPLYQDIERMAFNAHLVWESGLNIDISKSRAQFKEPYYYNASISNVISIKYKLYSFGIVMDDLPEAAVLYNQKLAFEPKRVKRELVALEHRRWVCEKICDGWVCNTDLESCISGETNDKKAKKHVCILRSTSDTPLRTTSWLATKWDNAGSGDLATLDELDRMSVRLHQVYKDAADKMRRESTLSDSTMLQLRGIVRQSERASIAYSEWYSCLLLLWNGNEKPLKEYAKLKKTLINSLDELNSEDSETAKVLIKLIDNRFSIIFKSMKYTDYKNLDTELVNYIPFILTHQRDTHLVIPFACGSNTEMFGNVAVATIVNPSEITYLYHFSKVDEVQNFVDAVIYASNYMREKTVSSKVNFVISYRNDDKIKTSIEQMKRDLFDSQKVSKIHKVILLAPENDACIAKCFCDTLSAKFKFDAVERNETPLSYLLLGAGFYTDYPTYQFDINTRKFYQTENCDFLQYIKAEQYLKVSDMFASKSSKGYLESPAAFYNDYEALWQKAYRKKEFVWKKMCRLLEKYHETSDRILTINFDVAKDKDTFKRIRFLVPARSYESVSKLISTFIDSGIFGKESEVYFYTTDSCEVNIYAPEAIEGKLRALMSDPYVFGQPENIEFVRTPYSVSIVFDKFQVERFDLKNAGKHGERIKELLHCLEEDFAFITGLREDPEDSQLVSFTYATKRIKKLLTNAGNILEVYIYHKCLKSGLFDDVATSYEINWEGTPVTSEFDVILTKGFAGLLVEAKATEEIDQDFYFKLSCLAKRFGTNCKPVLVADTVEKPYDDNTDNETQRLRGDMLDVITIFNSREIDSIDVTLSRILRSDPKPDISATHAKTLPIKKAETPLGTSNQPQSPKMTREEFLAQKISVLRVEQNLLSILQNNGIRTIADFLAQTEESFSAMKAKNGMSYPARFLQLQGVMQRKLENL